MFDQIPVEEEEEPYLTFYLMVYIIRQISFGQKGLKKSPCTIILVMYSSWVFFHDNNVALRLIHIHFIILINYFVCENGFDGIDNKLCH